MGVSRQRLQKVVWAWRSLLAEARHRLRGVGGSSGPRDEPVCTIASAHFKIKGKHDGKYEVWFENSMRIDCPLVFYADAPTIDVVKPVRGDLPTVYVETSLEDCLAYRHVDRFKTHETHVPSPELAVVWNEKVNFVRRTADADPFGTEFFCWMDAGHCVYRDRRHPPRPWPDPKRLRRLAAGKVGVSTSSTRFDPDGLRRGEYRHLIAGGSYHLHRDTVSRFHAAYYEALEEVLREFPGNIIGSSDQCVMSYLHGEDPELFQFLCHGYGNTIPFLY